MLANIGVRVLPSKNAIAPVNTAYLPKAVQRRKSASIKSSKQRMGSCFSDIKGGQQAVGGNTSNTSTPFVKDRSADGRTVAIDVVDHFYRAYGSVPLFTQLEVQHVCSCMVILFGDTYERSDEKKHVII